MDHPVWSLLGVLAVVILILYMAYLTTKWIGTHSTQGGAGGLLASGSGSFRLIGQLAVGRSERLVLVRLSQRCYLLGVTEHQITLLRELDGDEAAEWIEKSENTAPVPGFREVLSQTLRKK